MEARVSVLEAHVEHIMADIASVKTDVSAVRSAVGRLETESAVLTERVKHLPGYGFVVTASILIVTSLTAVIVFSDKIQGIIGAQ
jgi:hypothetical protein